MKNLHGIHKCDIYSLMKAMLFDIFLCRNESFSSIFLHNQQTIHQFYLPIIHIPL